MLVCRPHGYACVPLIARVRRACVHAYPSSMTDKSLSSLDHVKAEADDHHSTADAESERSPSHGVAQSPSSSSYEATVDDAVFPEGVDGEWHVRFTVSHKVPVRVISFAAAINR